jgi:very-short-patch-repair endonuclease
MIECQICKRMLGALSGKHLASHNITAAEYRERFPGHDTRTQKPVSEMTRAKMRASRAGYKHSQETKDKIGAKHKGKTRTPEEIDRWRASYAEYLKENGSPMTGKDRGEAFKRKMSEIAKNRSPEMVRAKVEQMWAARRGSKATDEQRERYSQARLKYMQENPDKLSPKMFDTRPEREFAAELDKRGFIYRESTQPLESNEYTRSFHLTNRVYDFKIGPDVLVEIDGPYHRDARFHGGNDASDEKRQEILERIIARDRGKDKLAADNGYRIYRIAVTNKLVTDWYDQLIDQGFNLF